MIKANELRKGNIIAFEDESGDIVEVVGGLPGTEPYTAENYFVYWKKVSGRGNFQEGNSEIDEFMGVKLSPEILEACGFEKFKTNREMTLPIIRDESDSLSLTCFDRTAENIYIAIETTGRNGDWEFQYTSTITPIEHLHQLQNLYYALTGTELEVNLNKISA